MSLMSQREHRLPPEERDAFEQQERGARWPALRHFGAPMVAYGTWEFGGPGDVVVTHTCYDSFDHWLAVLPGGDLREDPEMMAEVQSLMAIYEDNERLPAFSSARVYELNDEASRPRPFYRRPGDPMPPPPPTFGRGSVVSQRTMALAPGQQEEFTRLSGEVIWPWLESQGGRLIGIGHDLMGEANEVTTWFAFPSLSEWHRLARPTTSEAPDEVVAAFTARASLVQSQVGRLLTVRTDWGLEG